MKTTILKSMVILALAFQIACQSKNQNEVSPTKASKIVEANPTMTAAGLTDAAEQLLTPTQFMLADKVLDMALEKDENNFKAQFYKKFLKSSMSLKGILTRIKPLVKKYGNLAEYENSIKQYPHLNVVKFLTEGSEDISSVKDIQNWISDYQLALNEFRKFLIVNQDKSLTLELNPQALEASLKDPNSYSCETLKSNENDYKFKCDLTTIGTKTISTPDIIAKGGYVLTTSNNSRNGIPIPFLT